MIEKHGLLPGRAVVIGNVMGTPEVDRSDMFNPVAKFRVIAEVDDGTITVECLAYKGMADRIEAEVNAEDRVCLEGLLNYERMVVENMLNLKPMEVKENGN